MQTPLPKETVFKVIAFYDVYEKLHGDGFYPQWSMLRFTNYQLDTTTSIKPPLYLEHDYIDVETLEQNKDYSFFIINFELVVFNGQQVWKQQNQYNIKGLDGPAKPDLVDALNSKYNETNKHDPPIEFTRIFNKLFIEL
jgi:hypothetical protein